MWLAIERLVRRDPPPPPDRIGLWLGQSPDPLAAPVLIEERLETVSAAERTLLLAADRAAEEDFRPVPERPDEPPSEPRFDRQLRLGDALRAEAEAWVEQAWQPWAREEAPRRRAIGIYGRLYRLQQQLELGGAESAIEAVWGIGPVHWTSAARPVDRPLIERLVELDLDPDGTLRVRPRGGDARVDLKPYEDLGCPNLGQLEEAIRHDIARTAEDDGITPFRPDNVRPDPHRRGLASRRLGCLSARHPVRVRPRRAHDRRRLGAVRPASLAARAARRHRSLPGSGPRGQRDRRARPAPRHAAVRHGRARLGALVGPPRRRAGEPGHTGRGLDHRRVLPKTLQRGPDRHRRAARRRRWPRRAGARPGRARPTRSPT